MPSFILPTFPTDAMFFRYREDTGKGVRWRITRPAGTRYITVGGPPGSWDVYIDGRVTSSQSTYEDFCTASCIRITAEEFLTELRELDSMLLPEGF